MVSKSQLEDGVKGTIEGHKSVGNVSIAIGFDMKNGEKHSTGYIYNIQKQSVDNGYLAVRISENGGSNPEIVEFPNELIVGFEYKEYNQDAILQICKQTISDIGFESTKQFANESNSVHIDMSDAF